MERICGTFFKWEQTRQMARGGVNSSPFQVLLLRYSEIFHIVTDSPHAIFFKWLKIQYLITTMPKTDLYHLVASKKSEIAELAALYGASHIRIFGSVARRSSDEHSDIDFLVEMEPGRTLFDLGGLTHDLEVLLGRHVDVCTIPLLREQVRDRIVSEAVPL